MMKAIHPFCAGLLIFSVVAGARVSDMESKHERVCLGISYQTRHVTRCSRGCIYSTQELSWFHKGIVLANRAAILPA